MSKPMSKMLTYVGIFFVILFGWYGAKKILMFWFMGHYTPPAIAISATQAKSETWQSYLTSVGTIKAINGVDISAETPGVVEKIHFTSGQMVKTGESLISLRSDIEEANLKSAQAKLVLAKLNDERVQKLAAKKVISQADVDRTHAALLEAEGSVASIQAQLRQKNIVAPFNGKVGIRQVNIGQYVSPGTLLVTLQSLDPLYVMFDLPEQYLNQLALNQNIDVRLSDGKIIRGKVTAINAKVEQATRNILVQATIPNQNNDLYPGMFGLVTVWLDEKKKVVTVPRTAVSYSLSGDYIFIIKNETDNPRKPNLHVYRQYVKVGEQRNTEISITDGLRVNDWLVATGQLKLQNGAHVTIAEKE